jgi:hypothetical protein
VIRSTERSAISTILSKFVIRQVVNHPEVAMPMIGMPRVSHYPALASLVTPYRSSELTVRVDTSTKARL